MNRLLLALSLSLLPVPLFAQDSGLLGGLGPVPAPLTGPLRFSDPNRPFIAPDGSVRRGYEAEGLTYDGPSDFGVFSLRPDGKICVDVSGGDQRCDVYLRDGKMRMLLSDGQGRLPFRFELGLGN